MENVSATFGSSGQSYSYSKRVAEDRFEYEYRVAEYEYEPTAETGRTKRCNGADMAGTARPDLRREDLIRREEVAEPVLYLVIPVGSSSDSAIRRTRGEIVG